MTRTPRTRWALLLAAGALALPLAGCTGGSDDSDDGGKADGGSSSAVAAADVVAGVEDAFDGQDVAVDAGSLTCPSALAAAKGQVVRCQFSAAGQPVEAVVTVTGVDGDDVDFDVSTAALPVPAVTLQREVAEQLTAQGVAVDGVTCNGDLAVAADSTVPCEVTSGGTTSAVTVTSGGADGGQVSFMIDAA